MCAGEFVENDGYLSRVSLQYRQNASFIPRNLNCLSYVYPVFIIPVTKLVACSGTLEPVLIVSIKTNLLAVVDVYCTYIYTWLFI